MDKCPRKMKNDSRCRLRKTNDHTRSICGGRVRQSSGGAWSSGILTSMASGTCHRIPNTSKRSWLDGTAGTESAADALVVSIDMENEYLHRSRSVTPCTACDIQITLF